MPVLILVAVGLSAMLAWVTLQLAGELAFRWRAVSTVGRVTALIPVTVSQDDGDGNWAVDQAHVPVVAFVPAGASRPVHTKTPHRVPPGRLAVGDTVTVRYDPATPRRAIIEDLPRALPRLAAGTAALAATTAAAIALAIRYR